MTEVEELGLPFCLAAVYIDPMASPRPTARFLLGLGFPRVRATMLAFFRGMAGFLLFFALAFVCACVPALAPPQVDSVVPGFVYTGEDSEVLIVGSGFSPQLVLNGFSSIEEDSDFRVLLRGPSLVRLDTVERKDNNNLLARLPAGAPPGTYDLEVVAPSGQSDTLAQALLVTSTKAQSIQVNTPTLSFSVRESVRLELQVVDPGGDDVPLQPEVALWFESENIDLDAIDLDEGLEDQQPREEGGIIGALDTNGSATFQLSADEVGRFRVRVQGLGGDDYLQGTSQWLYVVPDTLSSVEIELNLGGPSVTAGQEFSALVHLVDAYGNQTEGQSAWLTVYEECADPGARFERFLRVDDFALLEDAAFQGATTPDCPQNRLRAYGSAGPVSVVGASLGVEVSAAPARVLEVQPGLSRVVAGTGTLPVTVRALDAYGNRATDFEGGVQFRDDRGGLLPDGSAGGSTCFPFSAGEAICLLTLDVAAPEVTIYASSGALEGNGGPIEVIPGQASQIDLAVSTSTLVAGESFTLEVVPFDNWGNVADLTDEQWESVLISDDLGPVACTPLGGAGNFECSTFLAREDLVLSAWVPDLGLLGETPVLSVVNGDLARIGIDLDGVTELQAGQQVVVIIQGFDAWANPYIDGTRDTIDLVDADSGSTLGSTILDATGEAAPNLRPVLAGLQRRIVARVMGNPLGESSPFDVLPGPATGLQFLPSPSWAPVGLGFSQELQVVDEFGNRVLDAVGTVRLQGVIDPTIDVQGDLVDGLVTFELSPLNPVLGEVLHATWLVFEAFQGPLDLVDLQCVSSPTAQLSLDGQPELVLCRTGGVSPLVLVSGGASLPGDSPIEYWHFDLGDGDWSRDVSSARSARWYEVGSHLIQALVVDELGCADLTSATVWVGDPDGQPVGPVEIGLVSEELDVESVSGGRTEAQMFATDCAGDPASGAQLLVAVDSGQLYSAASSLAVTGEGLQVTLAADGSAALDWSVEGEPGGTTARFSAGRREGTAYGAASALLLGDTLAPTVLDLEPVGAFFPPTDTLLIHFSEPLWAPSLLLDRFTLRDPWGVQWNPESLQLNVAGDELELVWPFLIDPTLGEWEFQIEDSVRDASGRRLDGAFTGVRQDFEITLGSSSTSVYTTLDCQVSTLRFRPDGDPGLDQEADTIQLIQSTDLAPSWWRLSVYSESGSSQFVAWIAGSAPDIFLDWGGQSQAGPILPAGDYQVHLQPADASWNLSEGCAWEVQLDQPFPVPGAVDG